MSEDRPEFQQRWLVYLDLLGMSEMMSSEAGREKVLCSYVDFVRNMRQKAFGLPGLMGHFAGERAVLKQWEEAHQLRLQNSTRHFSDSIFLHSEVGIEEWLDFEWYIVNTVQNILRWAWAKRLPVRGSIAYGPCYISDENAIIVGPGVVKTVRWESIQDWPWVSIEPSTAVRMDKMLGLDDPDSDGKQTRVAQIASQVMSSSALVPHEVPTKEGRIRSYAMKPEFLSQDDVQFFVENWRKAYSSGSAQHIVKWANVLRFFAKNGVRLDSLKASEKGLIGLATPNQQS